MYNLKSIVRQAILEKRLIQFLYDGGPRTVEPHCLGITTAGNLAIRAFQVRGFSLSGGIPDWRMFELAKMSQLQILNTSFSNPRPGYRRGDRGMEFIESEL